MKKKKKLLSLVTLFAIFTILISGCNINLSPIPSSDIPENIITLANIPDFNGEPYIVLNSNRPYFTESEITDKSYEFYSELDTLGRCGTAYACIGVDIMPTEDRGNIGSVKPSGWHSVRYDIVDGKYLYNRCHLIAYMLAGENANEKNLITGTRFLNIQGMLPFEDMVHDYVRETKNHVMYRVTPIFKGDNLLANGCLLEGYSVEDNGDGIMFCVYAYNAQPGITIDYETGESCLESDILPEKTPSVDQYTYVLNTNSKKFHKESCSQISRISDENKSFFCGTYEELINNGYSPCKSCCDDGNNDKIIIQSSPTPSPSVLPTLTPSPNISITPTPSDSEETCCFVLNTSSKKFHKESCSQVKRIKEENKAYYTGTLKDLLKDGYSACNMCCK